MSATTTSPQRATPGISRCARLSAPSATVRSAAGSSVSTAPSSVASPLGRSTATRCARRRHQPPRRRGDRIVERPRQAGAEQRVDQQRRGRGIGQRLDRRRPTPRAPRARRRSSARPTRRRARATPRSASRRAIDIAVAAIIARPAQHQRLERPEAIPGDVRRRAAGALPSARTPTRRVAKIASSAARVSAAVRIGRPHRCAHRCGSGCPLTVAGRR